MRAWITKDVGTYVELVELPDPVPEAGQVVLDVNGAGLCHTDISIMEGPGVRWTSGLPLVLGHEVAGTISALGEGVEGFAIGDRVAIGYIKAPPWGPGLDRNGGYGEKVIAYPEELVAIPESVSFAEAAVATDAAGTSYYAVHGTAEITDQTIVGVIGLGGLGLNGVKFASLAGAKVYGVDIDESTFPIAKSMGAIECFDRCEPLNDLKPDVILDFAGFGTTAGAISAVRSGGTIVQVGLGAVEATIPIAELVLKQVRLVGSLGSTKDTLVKVLDLIASGAFKPVVESLAFEDIGKGIQRLRDGSLTGRLAVDH